MATKFEIIMSNVSESSLVDCFGQPDVRCISGLLKNVLIIQGSKGLTAYYDLIKQIHNSPKIKINYTFKHVQEILDSLIIKSFKKKNVTQKEILKTAKEQLQVSKIETYDISRNIYGIKLSKSYRKIGPFIFQKGENAYKHYFQGHPWKHTDIKKYLAPFVVRYHVESVTKERAIEIADDVFTTLEYLFAFILGNKDSRHEIRILRQTKENMLFYLLKSGDGQIGEGHSRQNIVLNEIDLNDQFFKNKQIQKLFSLVPTKNLPKIENRLNKAITWIGKGLLSDSPIESIICYCSAMESLLIRDSKTIVSPSIVASLSDYCAFLLGKTLSQRKKITRLVKSIYSERSAGTHGGKVIADPQIEKNALSISRSLVFRFLELYPQKIKNEQDVIEFIDKIKYS